MISESVLRDDVSGSALTHMKDLLMLMANESGARERSEREHLELLAAAGFDVTDLARLDAPRDLWWPEAITRRLRHCQAFQLR